MRNVLLVLVVLCSGIASAQVEKEDIEREKALREKAAKAQADTTPVGWTHAVVAGVNLTQASFTNWAAGGENSLAYSLSLIGRSSSKGEQWDWMNTYKFVFGQARLSDQGIRNTEDEIFLESLLLYKLRVHLSPYASFTFRTQFAPGYKYSNDGSRIQVSQFADPAYITQSVGMAYRPAPEVITRLGIGVRENITSTYRQYADDPKTVEVEKTRIFGGMEWVTDVNWEFYENMKFASRLELFSPFVTPDKITTRWDNVISAKVNEYINVLVSVQLLYDEVVLPRTQVKEGISIGLSYTLL
jgi:hypothetical protein